MKKAIQQSGNAIITLLVILLVLRIATYFELIENKGISSVVKAGTRFLWMGCSILLLRFLINKRGPIQFIYKNILAAWFYMFYLLLGIASLLWSTNLIHSGKQLAMDIEQFLFAYYYWKTIVAYNASPHYRKKTTLSELYAIAVLIISIWFIIGMWLEPDLYYRLTHGGTVARLGGYIINPNELGMLCVIGIGGVYVEVLQRGFKWYHFLMIVMAFWVLVLTGSRSSQISFFLLTLLSVLSSGNKKLIAATIVAGSAGAPVVFFTIFLKAGDASEVMSMTGRLPFWIGLMTEGFPKEPLLGYGFMRIAWTDRFATINFVGAMTHNTFLQILMNLGLIGMGICISQMVFTARGYLREIDRDIKLMGLALFVPAFINSLTEFGIFGECNYGILFWLNVVFAVVIYAKPGKPIHKFHR